MSTRWSPRQLGLAAALPLFALAAAACGNANKSAAQADALAPFQITGRVVDEAGAPIAAAQVAAFGGATATTDAQGSYSLTAQSAAGAPVPLSFSATGHAAVSRALRPSLSSLAMPDITLRAVDVVQAITLPAAGEPPVSVSVQKNDGAASLTIAAGSLVGPDGKVAAGAADVSLTYWYPQTLGPSIPGQLNALGAQGDIEQLFSYGMADIEVHQGSDLLQVAPGQTVKLSFTTSAYQKQQLAAQPQTALPQLFWLDPSLGLWRAAQSVGDGNLVYDAGAGIFAAALPHLSAWNMDGTLSPTMGGCVTGQAINSCTGKPLSCQPVTLWVLGTEQLSAQETISAADGSWCMNVGLPRGNPQPSTFQYLLTGATIDKTSQCNPLPNDCRTCDPGTNLFAGQQACNTCKNTTLAQAPPYVTAADTKEFYGNNNACQPASPSTTLVACSFCNNSAPQSCDLAGQPITHKCQQLTTLVLPGPGCNCAPVGGSCATGKSCCIGSDGSLSACNGLGTCVSCAQGRGHNQTCGPSDVCCDPAYPNLVCSDGFCVSPDPT